jgi:hypothetical protein
MEPRECILHIGICKTGTTSIQHALASHSLVLAENGIRVARCYGTTHNHRHLGLLAVDPASEGGQREWRVMHERNPALRTCASLPMARKLIEEALAKEIADTPQGHRMVFSSEQLSQRLLTDAEVYRLRSALEQLGFNRVTIVVYVREQVGLALSWDSMEVLAGGGIKRLSGSHLHFDHRSLIERWESVWGRDAMQVRTYANDCLEQRDIVQDFVTHALGINKTLSGIGDEPRRNTRLGRRTLWMLRQSNRMLSIDSHSTLRWGWRSFIFRLGKSKLVGGGAAQASEEEIAYFKDIYNDSNSWVDENYGTKLQMTFGQT